MADHMLTTIDNPYNPFKQEDEWRAYDWTHGYHTDQYLAAFCHTSMDISKENYDAEVERAIDEAIEKSPLGIHIKVTEDTVIRPIPVEVYMDILDDLVDSKNYE